MSSVLLMETFLYIMKAGCVLGRGCTLPQNNLTYEYKSLLKKFFDKHIQADFCLVLSTKVDEICSKINREDF